MIKNKKRTKRLSADFKINEAKRVWHKFQNWIVRTYGRDLYGEWQFIKGTKENGKPFKFKYRSFNDLELSRRLVGYDVMCRVKKYIKRYCPEIKIISCDDSFFAGSDLLLVPHPYHGITIIFIPQCTSIQNQFFLYDRHYSQLMRELKKMKSVYKKSI